METQTKQYRVVMLGASGAVGSETLKSLLQLQGTQYITILGRRPLPNVTSNLVQQHTINIFDGSSYTHYLKGHRVAICTLGVGEPSKISKEEFIKIDKTAVLQFAKACKAMGITHFELLASVGINTQSASFYLRTKGELVEELKALNFERLSIFQPSMILTPTNRYGFTQGITLLLWPFLKPLLIGSLKKYRGISVAKLGESMAKNIFQEKTGYEILQWNEFNAM